MAPCFCTHLRHVLSLAGLWPGSPLAPRPPSCDCPSPYRWVPPPTHDGVPWWGTRTHGPRLPHGYAHGPPGASALLLPRVSELVMLSLLSRRPLQAGFLCGFYLTLLCPAHGVFVCDWSPCLARLRMPFLTRTINTTAMLCARGLCTMAGLGSCSPLCFSLRLKPDHFTVL